MYYNNGDELEKILEGIDQWEIKRDREQEIDKRAAKKKKKTFDNGGEMIKLINTLGSFTDGFMSEPLRGSGVKSMLINKAMNTICTGRNKVKSTISPSKFLKNLGL